MDWIEGSILFDETEDEFSVMDVVDVLISEEIYDNQDFAEQIVVDAWNELTRRVEYVRPGRPFAATNSELKRFNSWQTVPAHSFCVLLSLSQCYRKWWDCVSSRDRNEQGELFELVTQESLREQFSDWQVKRTGLVAYESDEIPRCGESNSPLGLAKPPDMILATGPI